MLPCHDSNRALARKPNRARLGSRDLYEIIGRAADRSAEKLVEVIRDLMLYDAASTYFASSADPANAGRGLPRATHSSARSARRSRARTSGSDAQSVTMMGHDEIFSSCPHAYPCSLVLLSRSRASSSLRKIRDMIKAVDQGG